MSGISPKPILNGSIYAKYLANPARPLGLYQSWFDVTAERVKNTSYQNTMGRAICVTIGNTGSGSFGYLQLSVNNIDWLNIGILHPNTGMSCFAVVPDNYFYKITNWNGGNWMELR